ncbi:phosphonate metabolism transcriptional regulator PhnF [Burkholderia cepacia]|uniref:phosphonate metabolism transcriptional regulator PhnF n=1 Tax=Burkholderia cepacia TaxID=292 RepID=UPI002AB600B7|nr:phosphonate metabolism transcriptional regulator PhnF [Burkholderia cepacia]
MDDRMDQTPKVPLKERRGATTLWRLVERTLEQEIRTGKLGPGAQVPTEPELAARFGVHRNTVRHALAVLRERDLIRIEQGRGTFVKERAVRHQLSPTARLTTFLRDIHRLGERRFLGFDHVRVDKELSRDLGLPRNRFARQVDTLTVIDDRPVGVASNYFPLPRFEGIEKHIKETGSFTESWKQYGVNEYSRRETRISAIPLSTTDSEILDLPARQPMLLITGINVDHAGIPILVFQQRAAPQFLEIVVQF